VSVLATGHLASVTSQGNSKEELEKRLGAEFLAGSAIVSIDNCEHPLDRGTSGHPDGAGSARHGPISVHSLSAVSVPRVRLFAGIALAPDSEAALHTRMLCGKQIVEIAGVIPQATPSPPPHEGP
jgi:hypothetical protein